jgi:hypothetical protein
MLSLFQEAGAFVGAREHRVIGDVDS